MITIKVFKKASSNSLKGINKLLVQWRSGYQIQPNYFKKLLKESHVIGLYDKNQLVGTVTLIEIHKLSGVKGAIEHLIVSENYRGRGLGKKLMKYAINLAKRLKIQRLFLTCEPERVVANKLYQKLGFKITETNFYQLNLK